MPTVLHIFSGDLWAGAEVMIFNLLSSLKSSPELRLSALSLNHGTLTRKLESAGLEVHVIPETENSFSEIVRQASRLVRGRDIKVIHSHRYKENTLAFLLARSLRLNGLVTTLHGMPELPHNGKPSKTRLKSAAHFLGLRHFFSKTVAVSRDIQTQLINEFKFTPSKTAVIHNGIDPAPFRTAADSSRTKNGKELHIGSVGRLVPVKGYEFFLEVAARILKELPDVRFSILGDGPLKEELENRAREYGLRDKVAFLEPVPNPAAYYRSLDLYVNTSQHEGIPLSILEAMFCRVPVVAPQVGGIPEIITHGRNGLLVPPRDPEAFSRTCIGLLRTRSTRESLSKDGYEHVNSNFTVATMANRYRELYLEAA